ncbi:uncharacterized protein LOC124293662 [Neodiprion lecontei]|uniref:Uncharacterized protein LOC124293662 n=1 Tax=Neodiprion lecontei TaxID=441921 RepID=A0ABM3FTV8_NEOLC|nr:uncharacterized protein LOC124215331 [Neodiprion pinetum]XP_046591442.1 uncharacterized protein LOC124293662 [Neodiprion lecontei]
MSISHDVFPAEGVYLFNRLQFSDALFEISKCGYRLCRDMHKFMSAICICTLSAGKNCTCVGVGSDCMTQKGLFQGTFMAEKGKAGAFTAAWRNWYKYAYTKGP